jgi:hypothetical protein
MLSVPGGDGKPICEERANFPGFFQYRSHGCCPLIVDVQGWDYAIGDDTGAKTSGSGFGYPSIEGERHLLGPADIQIRANHILVLNCVS